MAEEKTAIHVDAILERFLPIAQAKAAATSRMADATAQGIASFTSMLPLTAAFDIPPTTARYTNVRIELPMAPTKPQATVTMNAFSCVPSSVAAA